MNAIVAVSHGKTQSDLLTSNIAGFIHVVEVDMNAKRFTFLSPNPGQIAEHELDCRQREVVPRKLKELIINDRGCFPTKKKRKILRICKITILIILIHTCGGTYFSTTIMDVQRHPPFLVIQLPFVFVFFVLLLLSFFILVSSKSYCG